LPLPALAKVLLDRDVDDKSSVVYAARFRKSRRLVDMGAVIL
jgi:hypothetical protein